MDTDTKAKGRILLDEEMFVQLTNEIGLDTDVKRAEAMGVTATTVYRLRKGLNSPSTELMYELPELLGVRTRVLFYREKKS
jgi:DNA-binding XRE family transcriptional regulator